MEKNASYEAFFIGDYIGGGGLLLPSLIIYLLFADPSQYK